jgi:hypothetical protein
MATALSGSTLLINNEAIAYVPNSLMENEGNPEAQLRAEVIGDGAVDYVGVRDYTTAKAPVKFDLISTIENRQLVRAWIQNFDQNVIKTISPDGTAAVYENALITNQVEIDTGNDGNITVEFEAKQPLVA